MNTNRIDRFPIRVSDSSGFVDITCFESIGKFQSSLLKVGQLVFIEGISVLENSKDSNKPYVACRPNYGAKIHCISALPGILNSPSLYKTSRLMGASNLLNFICKATIVKVIPIGDSPVVAIRKL